MVMGKTCTTKMQQTGMPPWSVDPNVRNFLRSLELDLEVLADEKYLKGEEDKPLIVVRRARVQRGFPQTSA